MEVIIQNFYNLFTVAWMFALANIIMIDIVMSGDNAILIGMATRKLQGRDRKKAIFLWIMLATILRIIFAFFAVYLLSIVGIKLAGWILLLYVVWKFYRELRTPVSNELHIETKKDGLIAAVYTIIIADVSMSLDNVLAVAGAAHENIVALGVGLVFSIVLMAFASNLIANYLDRFPQIQWGGLLVIMFVAIEMIHSGSIEISKSLSFINIFPFILFILSIAFVVLHTKYIRPADERKIQTFIQEHIMKFLFGIVIFLTVLMFFGDVVFVYIQSHSTVFYSILLMLFCCFMELISLSRTKIKIKKK